MSFHSIITGDLINSRTVETSLWLPVLEKSLEKYSTSFSIFRGDSFQLEVKLEDLFECLFYLKASLKSIEGLDVRLGVGVGSIVYADLDIKRSTGDAFIFSGESLDELGKENLSFKSYWATLDECVNLILNLSSRLVDQWTVNMSETVKATLEYPELNQVDLAKRIGRNHQSQLSKELNKANFGKIQQVIQYCTQELLKYAN